MVGPGPKIIGDVVLLISPNFSLFISELQLVTSPILRFRPCQCSSRIVLLSAFLEGGCFLFNKFVCHELGNVNTYPQVGVITYLTHCLLDTDHQFELGQPIRIHVYITFMNIKVRTDAVDECLRKP